MTLISKMNDDKFEHQYRPTGKPWKEILSKMGLNYDDFPKKAEFETLLAEKQAFDNLQKTSSKQMINDYFDLKYGLTVEQIIVNYIQKVNSYCSQIGIGYKFCYQNTPPGCYP